MKTFDRQAAQGDVLITRVSMIPDNVQKQEPENGRYIVAHSETGHHHTVPASDATLYLTENPLISFLVVGDKAITLLHERSFDTHESLEVKPGTYEIRRSQEYTPKGWRQVLD